jgi:hypothetical protein
MSTSFAGLNASLEEIAGLVERVTSFNDRNGGSRSTLEAAAE